MKIKDLLEKSVKILKNANIETPITDSQILISNYFKIPRWKLITDKNKDISEKDVKKILDLINKRAKGIPVAYLTKKKEFFGINFYVDERVLIPRPETEILVEKVLEKLKGKKENIIGLDIGIGSGAIAISLLKNKENLFMYGVDISQKALEVAEINAKLKLVNNRLILIKSNLFSNLDKNLKFDFIVSNPPYISLKEYKNLKPEVKKEPKISLIAGKNGLIFYERIITIAPKYLKKAGFLALEVGYKQADIVKNMLEENNYKNVEVFRDLNNIERVVIGFK